jgi:catechol 2,3-dioxygenase-like lactoylglutathione lyase family enzyme
MLGAAKPIAFVTTADPDKAKRFYSDTLGLALQSDDQFSLVYDLAGTMLRVAKSPGHKPLPGTVLGWSVPDIAEVVAGLGDKGVSFERFAGLQQDELGIWASPSGARVAWFKDTDGNMLSLTQF